MSYSELHTIS
jgi:hypothetical protein